MKSICKLCLEHKPLIGQSHIIPDFMYQDLYDGQHRIFKIDMSAPYPGQRISRPSNGEYEGNLLCAKCDNVTLKAFEDYASMTIYGSEKFAADNCPQSIQCISPEGIKFMHTKNVDYKKFKLFMLSILWRASITSRPFFSEVSLGQRHEEKIRNMLLTSDAGEIDDYPTVVFTYLNSPKSAKDLITKPRKVTANQHTYYVFLIGGLIFQYSISKNNVPEYFFSETVKPNGEMNIVFWPEHLEWEFITLLAGRK